MIENADIDYLIKHNIWVVVIPLKNDLWQVKIYKRKKDKEWIETNKSIKRSAMKAYEWSASIVMAIVDKKEKLKNNKNELYKYNKKVTKQKKKMGDKKKQKSKNNRNNNDLSS